MNRWPHLSLCVLDAVFSIGARYTGVVRVCHRYAKHANLEPVLVRHEDADQVLGTEAEQPIETFVADVRTVGPERFALEIVRNRGRTSTRNGIRKADAALQYAEILLAHDVHRLADVSVLLASPERLGVVETDLRAVPGNGFGNVRLGYLWMLTGDDENIKPDRMVLRWLARHLRREADVAEARDLIPATARRIGCTPWGLDHAVWLAESGRASWP